ncbi:hypothetical protein, partial [Achromobacter ruhlandii]|uniref:hypothetical protein n=1 Tax=Achromobacter ruhlandii TaxID=72557 RepID=UPI003B9F6E6C
PAGWKNTPVMRPAPCSAGFMNAFMIDAAGAPGRAADSGLAGHGPAARRRREAARRRAGAWAQGRQ